MSISSHHITADQLLGMPDDGKRYELVEGVLQMMSPAGGRHGTVAFDLAFSLGQHVKSKGLGSVFAAETGFLISTDPDTVRAPDVAFVRHQRMQELKDFMATYLWRRTSWGKSCPLTIRRLRSKQNLKCGSQQVSKW